MRRSQRRLVDGNQSPAAVATELALQLEELLSSSERREEMSRSMLRLARPAAAWHVANMILDRVRGARQGVIDLPLAA